MTAEVGSIIGYLRLDRSDWDNELRAAGAKADELARHSPDIRIKTNAPSAIAQLSAVAVAVKRLQDAQGAEAVAEARLNALRAKGITEGPKLAAAENAVEKARRAQAVATIQLADANDRNSRAMAKAALEADKLAKSADNAGNKVQFNLVGALAAVAPAAVPIAGVAGGALLGLIPVTATVMLGIKGISNEMKSGALQGSQFALEVGALKTELAHLEQVSAAGIMTGLTQALGSSHGLFQVINQDIGVMSGQLGEIIGGLGPGLLRIFTELNPLFVTFGHALVDGASHLEVWATSSNGVAKFVAYVQTELPPVLHFMGELVTLLAHLVTAAAPFGGVLLSDLTLFVGVLNRIPVPLLERAIPVAVALYGALKVYQLITPGVAALNNVLGLTGPKAIAAAAAQTAAALQVEAATAQEAAAVAASKAQEAAAASEAAASIAASAEATDSVLAAGAAASAEAAAVFAAAMQTESTEAAAAAASIAASADAAATASTAAAAEVAASSRTAAVGWTAALGPIGAVAAGAALLIPAFLHSGQAAQDSANEINNFSSALQQSKGAIDANVRATVAKSLADKGLLEIARAQDIPLQDVTNAALGQAGAWDTLQAAVNAQGNAYDDLYAKGQISHDQWYKMQVQLVDLVQGVGHTGDAFSGAAQKERDETAAAATTTNAATSQKAAFDALNATLGTTVSNLLSAAQSEDQFKTAVLNVTSSVKQNGTSLSMNTSKGLANRDALLAAMQAALSYRDAQEKSGVSVRTANDTLAANVQQLEASAIHAGLSKTAVYALVRQMDLVPKDIRTKFDVNTAVAKANIAFIKQQLAELPSYKTITVDVTTRGNLQGTINSQVPHHADGGTVIGAGTDTSDSVPIMASNGEEVINAKQASKHRALLKAINAGVDGFAAGGTVGATVAAQVAASLRPQPTTGATVNTRKSGIPHFAAGVTDFAGGLAMVHRDELLVNLPKGTDVVPANRAKAAFGGTDITPLVQRLDRIEARLADAPVLTGQAVGAATVGVIDRYGQAHAKQADRLRRQH